MDNPSSIFETMKQFFIDEDRRFSRIEGKDVLRMGFSGKNMFMRCFAEADETLQQILFYSILDEHAPAEKRQQIAEFITRANYGLKHGNFEMDFYDGEIRFKTFLGIHDGKLTPAMIRNLVDANVHTLDQYGPGIMAVLYGDVDPAQAISRM